MGKQPCVLAPIYACIVTLTASFISNMQVFLIFSILMYLVATIHLGRPSHFHLKIGYIITTFPLVFAGFRFYKSIFLNDDLDSAISYLRNPNHWEFLGLVVLLCIQTWLGDALVVSGLRTLLSSAFIDRLSLLAEGILDLPMLLHMGQQPVACSCPHVPISRLNW